MRKYRLLEVYPNQWSLEWELNGKYFYWDPEAGIWKKPGKLKTEQYLYTKARLTPKIRELERAGHQVVMPTKPVEFSRHGVPSSLAYASSNGPSGI